MQWHTITTYVDKDTGEILPKLALKHNLYIKLNYTSTTKIHTNGHGTKHITWKCEKNRQTALW